MKIHLETLLEFFESGGPVLTVVLIASLFLWILILERYWFFLAVYPGMLDAIVRKWRQRKEHASWYALRVREGLLADIAIAAHRNLVPIQAVTAILPLLGLLGTVTGMIAIFDVLNIFGTGNTRGMAAGISRALLPTTAGLVTALAGLYFTSDLVHRARIQSERAKDLLQV